MLESMYSGISGMSASNQELNVIGNNIANSQTTAFKASNVTFADMFSQTVQQSTAPTATSGGINSSEVGTGTKVEEITKNMTNGSTMTTNNPLDNFINGNGFFILGTGPVTDDNTSANAISVDSGSTSGTTATSATSTASGTTITHGVTTPAGVALNFSRDGAFSLDADGNLVNATGDRVMGYSVSGSGSDGTAVTNSITTSTATPPVTTVSFVDGSGNGTVVANDKVLVPLVIPSTVTETDGTVEKVSSYSIGQNGVITATLADNKVAAIGQIALASFNNEEGLDDIGNNMYSTSSNSGDAILNTGVNSTSTNVNSNGDAYGSIKSNTLEASNVDLATEFSNMIEASRSFEANGKIISTGDEILQAIINLKQ
jgi:flagellar hook protein FlgE